jgi:DNA replication protein DnaC
MSNFLINGSRYDVVDSKDITLKDKLPPETFIIKEDPRTEEFYLQSVDSPAINNKVYGDVDSYANRVISVYKSRPGNTGILLIGEKGSGKTLLAKTLSAKGRAEGYPSIIINEPLQGDKFSKFLQNIEQQAVILFDEFEKVYDEQDQEKVLTILDGVFASKKLFILTCNDVYRIDSHLKNRPGRIFYTKYFKGLAEDSIVEFCKDKEVSEERTGKIVKISKLFSDFNFDMLGALVEEGKRFNEEPEASLEFLNFKPEAGDSSYGISIFVKGVKLSTENQSPTVWRVNPMASGIIVVQYDPTNAPEEQDTRSKSEKENSSPDSVEVARAAVARRYRARHGYDIDDGIGGEDTNTPSTKERVTLKLTTDRVIVRDNGDIELPYDDDVSVVFSRLPEQSLDWRAI